ncbi:hypothetical protein [Enterococcus sp. DIV0800]|uniref:hypothetical protein n=1 Tax=unclassified Enterococcus TaxID=2608891 RepID=UPI003D2FE956
MGVLALISIIVTLFIIGVLGFRAFIDYRLATIETDEDHTESFKRKLGYVKRREQSNHIYYLITISVGIIVGILVLVSLLFGLQVGYRALEKNTSDITNEIEELNEQQKELGLGVKTRTRIVIKDYPRRGIDLSEYDWNQLFEEPDNDQLKADIESGVTRKILDYFKLSDLNVSINEKDKSITIDAVQQAEHLDVEKTIERNLTHFVNEAEGLPHLKEIHFRLRTNEKDGIVKVQTVHFNRKTDKASFKKVNDFEQDVKQGGEKG